MSTAAPLPEAAPASVLRVERVSRIYRSGDSEVRALDDVSMEIRAGEVVGITGPSGSGKSTMLLIAGLLEPPSEGDVWLGDDRVSYPGVDLDALRDLRRKRIGFVFQKANLIPFLTAQENVALALEIDDVRPAEARAYAAALLGAVDLAPRLQALPKQMSGGEQQRVAVARALANDPRLLLADEPTAALDVTRAAQVMDLFREIARRRGAGVAVVSHDHRSLDMTDRVVRLVDGKIVA